MPVDKKYQLYRQTYIDHKEKNHNKSYDKFIVSYIDHKTNIDLYIYVKIYNLNTLNVIIIDLRTCMKLSFYYEIKLRKLKTYLKQ